MIDPRDDETAILKAISNLLRVSWDFGLEEGDLLRTLGATAGDALGRVTRRRRLNEDLIETLRRRLDASEARQRGRE